MRRRPVSPKTSHRSNRRSSLAGMRPRQSARTLNSLIGDELYPVVGVEGKLLASFDGLTMDGETVFEHKLWNEQLATQIEVGELEPAYYWQLEQQLHVSKAKRVIFVCSDGTPEKCVHMFYTPEPGRAARLLLGWQQFDADLCAWTAPAPELIVEKKAIMALPALSIQLVGKVSGKQPACLPGFRAGVYQSNQHRSQDGSGLCRRGADGQIL